MRIGKLAVAAILVVQFIILPFAPDMALAASGKAKAVIKLEKELHKSRRQLSRSFNKLSLSERAQVVAARAGKSDDSDGDGVLDNFEPSSGRCNSDSDGDGMDDGSEYGSGNNPYDDDSSSGSIERKGVIQSLSGSEISVGGTLFVINSSTVFKGRDNEILTISDFSVGGCVEAEGRVVSGSNIADKIKKDNDC